MSRSVQAKAVVIGSGPGGYVCAIRLAQLGVSTILVEKKDLGGVCLNVGCIPSKALISASKLVSQIREAGEMGIHVSGLEINLKEMIEWKGGIVNKLTGGVEQLVTRNGGSIVRGMATFTGPNSLDVRADDGSVTKVGFEYAVIATGSTPAEIPGFSFDGENVLSSSHVMEFSEPPKKLAVVGGGYIGMELGSVFQRLGTHVTVIEYADRILPGFERDLVRPVEKRFTGAGGTVLTGTMAKGWKKSGDGVKIQLKKLSGGDIPDLEADAILLTVGRRPTSGNLGLETIGVKVDNKGFIEVDGAQRTNLDNIFAIGDVAGEPMLAHKASKEGEVAAEVIAGHPAQFDLKAIPAVVFTDPEIASVGMTRKEAQEAGHKVATGKFSFGANGRAMSLGETEGFVRVVIDKDSEVILGFEAVGPEVSNLIAEGGLALEMGALATDVGWTIHAHPTLSEVLMEAANAALGQAVHAVNRK